LLFVLIILNENIFFFQAHDSDVDLDTFLGRLGDCQTVVKALNKRVCIHMQVGTILSTNPSFADTKSVELKISFYVHVL